MSHVFLHIGQCGNQLGQSFWEEMDSWTKVPATRTSQKTSARPTACRQVATSTHLHRLPLPYSLPDGSLPCVLVDSEPKVVQRCARSLSNRVPKENVIIDKTGRGNNWAYGYSGRRLSGDQYGPSSLAEQVVECVRRVVERCDRCMGTVLFHSLAGGTGSGLGSALIERLRDDYPLAYLLSVLVAPFKHGETPLQHYNSLLSLSWIQHYCDAALLFQNDSVLEQLHRQGGRGAGSSVRAGQESVEEMNTHISKCLCNVFQPLWTPKSSKACFEPVDMVRSLCPDPSTKFITPVHTDSLRATTSWDQLISTLTHPTQATTRTSSMIFIARGNRSNIDTLARTSKTIEHRLKQAYNAVKWNPFPVDFWLSQEPQLQERKCVAVLANSSSAGDYIRSVCDRAEMMFEERAYLHWYERYECEQDVFREAFQNVRTVVDNYSTL